MKSHFYAVTEDGTTVVARSPYFRVDRKNEHGLDAPTALRALIDELRTAGWTQIGAGRAPWDLRFERGAELVAHPVGQRRRR